MKRLIIFTIVAGLAFGTLQLFAQQPRKKVAGLLQYSPADEDHWVVDPAIETGDELDADHYFFADNEDIDLSIVRTDLDMLETLNKSGKDEVIRQLQEGETIANTLFGVPDSKILESRLETRDDVQILKVHSTQELPSGVSEQLERYYIVEGQNLQVLLRWKPSADPKAVSLAKSDFEKGRFSIRGAK
jgi:Asp-tRNA(Asn)/Glu-tRNA(Gln) amidotransferase C subunit